MPEGLSTTNFGRTGLQVTRLGYGAMEMRGTPRRRPATGEEAGNILNAVLDAGINFIDTSIDYGRSEEFIGRYISHRRSEFYLASKCGCPVGGYPTTSEEHTFTRENIVAGVNQSLARMKTDHLDFLQLHGGPSKEALDEEGTIETLLDLQREGKIRFIGSSSTLPSIADHLAMGVFDELQIPYSALQREHEEIIDRAADAGIGTVIRGGVSKGEAVGRDALQGGTGAPSLPARTWSKFDEAKLDELREAGESQTGFLLRFTLTHPGLHTTIVGTRNPDHLRENLRTARRGPLPQDTYEEAKRRLGSVGVKPPVKGGRYGGPGSGRMGCMCAQSGVN